MIILDDTVHSVSNRDRIKNFPLTAFVSWAPAWSRSMPVSELVFSVVDTLTSAPDPRYDQSLEKQDDETRAPATGSTADLFVKLDSNLDPADPRYRQSLDETIAQAT